MRNQPTGKGTAPAEAGAGWTAVPRGRAVRVVFRLAMAALIVLLAVRTYEETAVAHARSNGSLHTAEATITRMRSHTESGTDGGGQDGGSGTWFVDTEYAIDLRVGGATKTVREVPDEVAQGLREGQLVRAALWHGRVVEVDGRDVWPGWRPRGWDLALFALYPLITGYVIALVAAGAHRTRAAGPARPQRPERTGPVLLGLLVAAGVGCALIVAAALGHRPPYWPLIPVGAGAAAALAGPAVRARRARSRRAAGS